MSRQRESIVPMDFEYDNKHGPIDPNSPFLRGLEHSAKKRKLSFSKSKPQSEAHLHQLNLGPPFGHPTGTHSVLDSPSKRAFATPDRPQLREPNGQTYLFSSTTTKPLPVPPHMQNANAWEPRTPQSNMDFSSGGETPNTPAQDSDAATPDTQLVSRMGSLSHGEKKSPRKRDSFLRLFSSNSSPSPSKEKYSRKAESRVMKRRTKRSRTALRDVYDSDNEPPHPSTMAITQKTPAIGFAANIPGVLTWVEAHPNLPAVLSYYMQFFVNSALGFFILWIVYAGYSAVVNDINIEASNKMRDIMHEIAICNEEYRRNHCDPTKRVPAMENMCQNWQRCMNQDAQAVARASVGARTFAMIFNSFIDEFSYKSMVFACLIMFGGFNLSNWIFGFYRGKHSQTHQPQHHDYPPIPQTPQRYPSGGYMAENSGWNVPYGTPYGGVNQHMLAEAAQSLPALPSSVREDERSPTKRTIFRR